MPIYFVMLDGKPYPGNPESKEAGGAYIDCWVKAEDEISAKNRAIDYANEEGWTVLCVEEIYETCRENYKDLPKSRKRYDEATKHGIGAIFYLWPVGSEDDG